MPWIELFPTQSTNLVGIIEDLESHLWKGHPYFYNDNIDRAHESTHGINFILRNRYTNGYRKCSGAYLLNNRAFIHEEPRGFTLVDLMEEIPYVLRGGECEFYTFIQKKRWNDHPLCIMDEFSAYLNGTKAGLEYNYNKSDILYNCELTIEFLGYLTILVAETQIDELNGFLHAMYDEVLNLISIIKKKKYNVDRLQKQLEIILQHFDHPMDYL